jgi:hypothetical protein
MIESYVLPALLLLTAYGVGATAAMLENWIRRPRWQPIETAPKDGSTILAVDAGGDLGLVAYRRGQWVAMYFGEPARYSDDDEVDVRPVSWARIAAAHSERANVG